MQRHFYKKSLQVGNKLPKKEQHKLLFFLGKDRRRFTYSNLSFIATFCSRRFVGRSFTGESYEQFVAFSAIIEPFRVNLSPGLFKFFVWNTKLPLYFFNWYVCISILFLDPEDILIKECFLHSPYFDQFADCLVFFNQNTAVKHRMQKKCESDVADMRRRV